MSVGRQTFQVQCNGLLDVALRLLQGLALRVTTGESWNKRYVAAARTLFFRVAPQARKMTRTPLRKKQCQ